MSSSSLPKELIELRASIDNIDAALIHMLAERFRCTKEVGRVEGAERPRARRSGREKNYRSNVCAHLPSRPASTPILPRSS